MWKHGVTAEKQTKRNMGDERLTAGLKEKEERKYRQRKKGGGSVCVCVCMRVCRGGYRPAGDGCWSDYY